MSIHPHLQTFQRIPKDERRFRIDPRFKAVLTDDRFRAIDGALVLHCIEIARRVEDGGVGRLVVCLQWGSCPLVST